MDNQFLKFISYIKSSVSKEDIEKQYRSYEPDYLFSFSSSELTLMDESYNPFTILESSTISENIQPYDIVVHRLVSKYSVEKWQFRHFNYNNIPTIEMYTQIQFEGFISLIPDIENNLKIIDQEMNSCGYKRIMTENFDMNGKQWILIKYNPVKKYSCDEWAKRNYLFHATEIENYDSIRETGILPHIGNATYMGESRSFFMKMWIKEDTDDTTYRMLKNIFTARKKYFGYSGKQVILTIDAYKLLEDIHFYFDPNMECCVFTNDVISPRYVDFMKTEEIDFING